MALLIRMTTAAGTAEWELPPRGIGQPLVVGRLAQADIVIPSQEVSRQHCLLFVHEGRWVVQDAGGKVGTLLNGARLTEGVFLNSGDVITVGIDGKAPTIVVDPEGTGIPVEDMNAVNAVQAPAAPMSSMAAVPPAREDAERYAVMAGAAQPSMVTDGLAAAAAARARYQHVRSSEGLSPIALVATGFVALGIIIGGIYLINLRMQAAHPVPQVVIELPRAPVERGPAVIDSRIFSTVPPKPKPKPAQVGVRPSVGNEAATRIAGSPATTAVEGGEPVDPRETDEAWQRVEQARVDPNPAKALVIYDDYKKDVPNSPYAEDLQRYVDDALDMVWWEHISVLCKRRDDAGPAIRAKEKEIREETSAKYKKNLIGELEKIRQSVLDAEEGLKNMGYADKDAPSLDDPVNMAKLRGARDKSIYEKWKIKAYHTITMSHGMKSPFAE